MWWTVFTDSVYFGMCFGFSGRCSESEERNIAMNFKIEGLVIGEKGDLRTTNRGDGWRC
jgi:hypothetical protein